ncbi:hypothetical protein LSH36_141g08060, partial [Paralvinella palmiformis]
GFASLPGLSVSFSSLSPSLTGRYNAPTPQNPKQNLHKHAPPHSGYKSRRGITKTGLASVVQAEESRWSDLIHSSRFASRMYTMSLVDDVQ